MVLHDRQGEREKGEEVPKDNGGLWVDMDGVENLPTMETCVALVFC